MAQAVSKNVLEALKRHGIRYEVHKGEFLIDGRDWRKYMNLCDEGKLPREAC